MSHKTPTSARSCNANTTMNSTPSRNSFRPPSRISMVPKSSSPIQPPRSRPGSAMSISRPCTPSFKQQEPYTGSISVSIRPNPNTIDNRNWIIDEFDNSITNAEDGARFVFDNVFPMDFQLSNFQVYNKSCLSIVNKFLQEGYNGTIFAYGMTGSGKTFSMKGSDADPGFVELAINDIFSKINDSTTAKKYSIEVSYLEIYNEKIIDLLSTTNSNQDLKIRDDSDYGTKVIGLTSASITSKQQLLQLIKRGDTNRKTSATDFNARSSRSHSILQIKLKVIDILTETELKSTLSLCDLAGLERAATSLERRKEGSYINKSLLALSNVINKLSSSTLEHIPYRDSKLTRLLQPALSGSSLVLILCTIHMGGNQQSVQQCVAETYKTLRFAARAKDIVINVERNTGRRMDGDSAKMIQELNSIIEQQKQEIMKLQRNNSPNSMFAPSAGIEGTRVVELEAENRVLREKLDHFSRLTDLQKTETVIVKNDILNDIITSGTDNLQMLMTNIEDFYKRMTFETNEYKAYIAHLENQLKLESMNSATTATTATIPTNDSSELYDVLKDQEEEIVMLKEQLKDKDQIIKSLSKTTRLRRLVDNNASLAGNASNTSASDNDFKRSNTITSSLLHLDKENYAPDLKEFKLSSRTTQSDYDLLLGL